MKKAILLLNGSPYGGRILSQGAYVLCCDGAYDWAKDKLKIDENLGDFDSLGYMPTPPPTEIYPSEKDYTDGEIAIHKLVKRGFDYIEIYGGSGGREDHFIGNLQLLYYAYKHGVSAKMINDKSEIFVAGGRIELKNIQGKTLSVFPFGGCLHISYSEGFKYAYPREIGYGECIGVSNVCNSAKGVIELEQGCCALVIINKGKV